jgi:hypothetical protein
MHYLRSPDIVEGYIALGCHMGTNKYPSTIPSSPTLRMFLSKVEGMLGSDTNPLK